MMHITTQQGNLRVIFALVTAKCSSQV